MPNAYVEALPKGRPERSAIEHFLVEDHPDNVLALLRASRRRSRLLARACRHLNDKTRSDQWRTT